MIKPFGGRILVKKINIEKKESTGGIILPDNAMRERVVRAEVIAVGEDSVVNVGDQIIIQDSFINIEITEGEEKYLLVKKPEILAIITEADDELD